MPFVVQQVKINPMQLLTAQPIFETDHPIESHANNATLAIILVGNDPSSELYVGIKQRGSEKYGVSVNVIRLPETASETEIIQIIEKANNDPEAHAIIVQLPLPDHVSTDTVLAQINPDKDVDSLGPKSKFISPVVQSVDALIKQYKIDISGKNVCLVGYGKLVGRPLHRWLEAQHLEPAIVDRETDNADYLIREADIIFASSGQKNIIHSGNTREEQIIFDCSGVDVDFEAIKDKTAAITPPRGSIGPLTVHFLFQNVRKTITS